MKEQEGGSEGGSSRACRLTPAAAALRPAAAGGQPEEGFHGAGRQCGAAGHRPTSALLGDQASYASRYARQADCATGRSRQRPIVGARQTAMYVIRELTDLLFAAHCRLRILEETEGASDQDDIDYSIKAVKNRIADLRRIREELETLLAKGN